HDFAVTRNWIVLPVFPLTSSMERAMGGKPPFAWEPDKGTHIAFIPRNGTVADVKWVSAPPCYVFHPMNHYETEDGKIVVDVMKFEVAPLFPLPDGTPPNHQLPFAKLTRWTFGLAGRRRRPLRRADLRAAQRDCGRGRRLAAERGLSRRGEALRPRGIRGDRPGRRPDRRGPPV